MAKPLILVVDDEKNLADSIAEALKNNGYQSIAVYSAKEAFEALEKNRGMMGLGGTRVSCIILDIKMPEMDGLQFLRKLREEYDKEIGVIILSAYGDEDKWAKASEDFVAGYLRKPLVDEHALISYLEGFLQNPLFMINQTRQKLFGDRFVGEMQKIKEKYTSTKKDETEG